MPGRFIHTAWIFHPDQKDEKQKMNSVTYGRSPFRRRSVQYPAQIGDAPYRIGTTSANLFPTASTALCGPMMPVSSVDMSGSVTATVRKRA